MKVAPLVFLHGSGCDKGLWSRQAAAFSSERTVVLVDLPGRGDETMPSTSDFDTLVSHARNKLPAAPAVVIGHSLGAAIALSIALANEERIAGLVLVGAAPKVAISPFLINEVERDPEKVMSILRATLFHRDTDGLLRDRAISVMRRVVPGTLANDLRAASSFDFSLLARSLPMDTLLICGSDDRVTPIAASATLQQIIGGRLQAIERTGHMPMIEKSDQFNETLRNYLRRRADALPRKC